LRASQHDAPREHEQTQENERNDDERERRPLTRNYAKNHTENDRTDPDNESTRQRAERSVSSKQHQPTDT
jgi:hypothetical protein